MSPPRRSNASLRRLLSQRGSYPMIAAAMASGQFPDFPVTLFKHVGDVYERVETAADRDFDEIPALRLAALVHEEPLGSLPQLLGSAGVSAFAPTVLAVTGAFGCIWKVRTDDDYRRYVEAHRPGLAPILLFELAHEGQSTAHMERAAEVGGLHSTFTCWAERLAAAAIENSRMSKKVTFAAWRPR
jgi:hypothetical protein